MKPHLQPQDNQTPNYQFSFVSKHRIPFLASSFSNQSAHSQHSLKSQHSASDQNRAESPTSKLQNYDPQSLLLRQRHKNPKHLLNHHFPNHPSTSQEKPQRPQKQDNLQHMYVYYPTAGTRKRSGSSHWNNTAQSPQHAF